MAIRARMYGQWMSRATATGRRLPIRRAVGDEPIWHDGKVVGWVTSGAYGHSVQLSLALGYIPAALAGMNDGFEIEIIGERRRAQRQAAAPFDPEGNRMRA